MNYPVWDVWFGAGLLIAVVSIVHVFVAHFAVGGGLFLVLTERKAYRENDSELLDWVKRHSTFFVLVTVVFGVVTGVGIWFTIGLIHPSGTSALIHSFVWGWAIEWVFFFIEITAALLYLYGWERVDRKTHLLYGWIYAISAFASMVIINGILTFMLTPGAWLENGRFWSGFFNPTYWPSLFTRAALALALAGVYALLTASLLKDAELKEKVVSWSARWVLPALVALALGAWWYFDALPEAARISAGGGMPTATQFAGYFPYYAAATFVLTLLALVFRARLNVVHAVLIFVAAFGTMGSFEYVREAVRKPYVIAGYMYGNALYASPELGDGVFDRKHIDAAGILNTARWVRHRELSGIDPAVAGAEIFRVECQSCHTASAYRGLKATVENRRWTRPVVAEMLTRLDHMHKGAMPPFVGTDEERLALADYVAGLGTAAPAPEGDGRAAFDTYCAVCHSVNAEDALFAVYRDIDADIAVELTADLSESNAAMPALVISEEESRALYAWAVAQFPANE